MISNTTTIKLSRRIIGNPACDGNVWAPVELSIFTMCANAVISVIATGGNCVIIMTVVKDPLKHLRTPFNYFLMNLAATDLILGAAVMPPAVYLQYMEAIGELTPKLNNAVRMGYFIVAMASLLNVIVLSMNRYVAIARAIQYRIYFSKKRCVLLSVAVWLTSATFPVIYLKIGAVNYYMLFACVIILTGLAVMLVIYIRVNNYLRRHIGHGKNLSNLTGTEQAQLRILLHEKKVTRTFFVILLMFVLTYITSACIVFVLYFWQAEDCIVRHVLRDLQSVLISSNSCVNPFICITRLRGFRKSVKILFTCMCRPCGRRRLVVAAKYQNKTQNKDNQ